MLPLARVSFHCTRCCGRLARFAAVGVLCSIIVAGGGAGVVVAAVDTITTTNNPYPCTHAACGRVRRPETVT